MVMRLVERCLFFTGVLAVTNTDGAPESATAGVDLMDMTFALCPKVFCVSIDFPPWTSTKYRSLPVQFDATTILLLSWSETGLLVLATLVKSVVFEAGYN